MISAPDHAAYCANADCLPERALPPGEGQRSGASRPVGPVLSFGIPRPGAEWMARHVPPEEQRRVRMMLHAMEAIHRGGNRSKTCARLAAQFAACAEFQGRRGYAAENLRVTYYRFCRGTRDYPAGDWRILLNKSVAKVESGATLPPKFVEWFRSLCESNQRVTSEAIRELHQIFRTRFTSQGKPVPMIPGYSEWPAADPATGVPAGWTEKNLYRYTPDKFELMASRIGRKAAGQLKLKVRTTRVGLKVGEFYEFDDHEFNLITPYPGTKKILRPRGFAVVDVLSGCCFSHVIKPTLWDEAEAKKRVLNERDFMWFVTSVLTGEGYRDDDTGTTLIVEHGTAAIRQAFAERIAAATGGRVKIERSGIHQHTAHGGQFRAAGGGNFRFKAHMEQFWRMIDDRLAGLPGQVGKDRDHSPEELDAVRDYTRKLLDEAAGMEPERAAGLQFPVVLYPQFLEFASQKFEAINRDRNHELEGWTKLGFFLKAWREDPAQIDWRTEDDFHALPESDRLALAPRIAADPRLQGALRMSRRDVWQRQRRELTRLNLVHLPALLGPQNAVRGGEPLTVRSGEFEFESWEMGTEPFRFIAWDGQQRFAEGEKFTCFVNPFQPTALVACDAKLRVVAVCPPVAMPARNDREGMRRAMGQAAHWEAKALEPVRERHAEQAQALEFMRTHNEAVRKQPRVKPAPVSTAGITAEDFLSLDTAEAQDNGATEANGAGDQLAAFAELE